MYFLQKEHNPPHTHAIYNDNVAAIDFMTGNVLEGYLHPKALETVSERIALHKGELKKFGKRKISKTYLPLNKEVSLCFTKLKVFRQFPTVN